jgi:hypothetical protein
LGGRFSKASGASRREIAKLRQQTMRLFENEVGACAKRSLRSLLETRSSCPDLIRASINLRNNFFRRRWITGQAR